MRIIKVFSFYIEKIPSNSQFSKVVFLSVGLSNHARIDHPKSTEERMSVELKSSD
ncbi:TPA: hypothetical protein ACX3E3_000666 [Vibrio parahaemolyticus]